MDWSSFVYKTSIEIVDSFSKPYHQVNWRPFTQHNVLENGFYEGFVRRHNFGRLKVEDNYLTYTLEVPEELGVFHAKCWFMFKFEETCRVNDLSVNCRIDEAPKEVEGLPYGRAWRRVIALEEKPSSIMFPNWHVNLVKCEPFRALSLYAKHDCSLLELEFVWCRHVLPKGRYETVLEFNNW